MVANSIMLFVLPISLYPIEMECGLMFLNIFRRGNNNRKQKNIFEKIQKKKK